MHLHLTGKIASQSKLTQGISPKRSGSCKNVPGFLYSHVSDCLDLTRVIDCELDQRKISVCCIRNEVPALGVLRVQTVLTGQLTGWEINLLSIQEAVAYIRRGALAIGFIPDETKSHLN